MKVCEAIPELLAAYLWLNGDELNGEDYLQFTPKLAKNPREEKTKNYRKHNASWPVSYIWDWYTKEPGIITEQALCKDGETELNELGFHVHIKPSYGKVQKDAIRKYGK